MDATAKEAYAFLLAYEQDHGYMPTRREIAEYFGKIRGYRYSGMWARYVLDVLERQNLIKIERYKLRGITIKGRK